MKKLGGVHPLLFAVYPILFLFSHNLGLVSLGQIVVPMVIVLVFALLLSLCLTVAVKDKTKGGVIASVLVVWFFSYGHLFNMLANFTIGSVEIGQHKYVFPVWGILVVSCVLFLIRTRRDLRKFADFLNIVALALVAITIVGTGFGLARKAIVGVETQTSAVDLDLEESDRRPDIYYVILDGCARADTLQDVYQLDVTEFNERLARRGFFVANRSRSNYSQTYLSLSSSLDFTYLDELVDQVGEESDNRLPLRRMIHDSRVVDLLRQRGYVFVSFASGMDFTQVREADRYLSNRWSLGEFHNILLNTTPIPGLLNRLLSRSSDFQYDSHRRRIIYTLESLKDVAKIDAPTFTLAHVMACHPPFVFGEDGEEVNPNRDFSLADANFFVTIAGREEYVEGYRRQTIFVLKKVEEAVEDVISTSPEPPIIVLQADHGGGSMLDFDSLDNTNVQERMTIFNAYYLPHGGDERLYHEITPVNTFRVILNHYFDANLDLLEDESFYSPLSRPYKLTNVTDMVDSN